MALSTSPPLSRWRRRPFSISTVYGLVLVAVPVDAIDLVWEPSRGGTLFPHLYGTLDVAKAAWVEQLAVGVTDARLSGVNSAYQPVDELRIAVCLNQIACYKEFHADVVKLVDTPDLGSGAARRGGSSPSIRTILFNQLIQYCAAFKVKENVT